MILSVDVGGTFTDFVVIEDGLKHFKVPSTSNNPEKAVYKGVKNLNIDGEVFHGTTIATNAFLENEGAKTAFVTNKSFEDILFIGRQTRPNLYSLNPQKPKPPIDPKNCYGISCRMDEKGRVLDEIDINEVKCIIKDLKEKDLSAAVCLLHSYVNNEHEEKIGTLMDEKGIDYSLSSSVSGEFREYERGMTTFIDAYLSPLVREYMSSVTEVFGKEPYIMKSGGGLEKASTVDPVDTLYSGPAGGVVGASFVSDVTGVEDLITLDMGGTSADMAAIADGNIPWKNEGKIGEFPIQAKMIDIVTIGSGGGSIAWCDEGGALRVGPMSAGADPGPVCYGRGGERPTVTDALLYLGYLDESYFLGGNMELDINASKKAIEDLAVDIDMNAKETALGIFRVANSKMSRTMKKITVERGLDPSDFSILAYGGAGPLHATSIADILGIERVIIPKLPGVFSALGMVTGDIVQDLSSSLIEPLSNKKAIEDCIEKLRDQSSIDGREETLLGLRYKGQSYHIDIPYDEDVESTFHDRHEKIYGYKNEDTDIEVVRVHLEIKKEREIESVPLGFEGEKETDVKNCLFSEGTYETEVVKRKNIRPGTSGNGPLIIAGETSTCLVPPGWRYRIDNKGLIILEMGRDI